MTGHRIERVRTVQAPPERVWEVLTDVAHADRTLGGVTQVEVLTEGPYRVGTRWRETRRMFGREATEEMQVTVAEAPTRTVVEAASSGVRYVTEFVLTPVASDTPSAPSAPAGTRLTVRFTAEQADANRLQRLLWRVLGGLGAQATGKVLARDLEDIAARAEAG